MIDAKVAKWERGLNRLDSMERVEVMSNMSIIEGAINKMVRAIIEGNNIDVVNHVILDGDYAEKCLVRWMEICDDKGWEFRARKGSDDYTRVHAGAMGLEVSCYEINLRLRY